MTCRLLKLANPNIVRFRGYSCRPSALLFEFCSVDVEGELVHNLRQLMNFYNINDYFNFSERLKLLIQSTSGMLFLHKNGVIHRDFKPSNLLVCGTSTDITVKLCDFDDIFVVKQTMMSTMSQINTRGMTLAYMAPEICLRKVKDVSEKTDVFSWAITCFEVMSNLPSPWSNVLPCLSDQLLIGAIKEGLRPDAGEIVTLYEGFNCDSVVTVLNNAWKNDPEQRPCVQEVSQQDFKQLYKMGEFERLQNCKS